MIIKSLEEWIIEDGLEGDTFVLMKAYYNGEEVKALQNRRSFGIFIFKEEKDFRKIVPSYHMKSGTV